MWFHGYNLHNCAISVSWRKNTDAFFGQCTTCIESLKHCELLHIKARSYCLQAVQGIGIKGQKTSLGMAFIRKWHNDSITTDITQSLAVAIGMKKRPLNTQTICCPPWTNLRQCSCTILIKYVTLSTVSVANKANTQVNTKINCKQVSLLVLLWSLVFIQAGNHRIVPAANGDADSDGWSFLTTDSKDNNIHRFLLCLSKVVYEQCRVCLVVSIY